MSFWKKIGTAVKKVLPLASTAAAFIPGVGPAISAGLRGVSSMWGGGSSAQAASQPAQTGLQLPPGAAPEYGYSVAGGGYVPPRGDHCGEDSVSVVVESFDVAARGIGHCEFRRSTADEFSECEAG